MEKFKTPYDQTLVQFYYDYKSTYDEKNEEEEFIDQFDSSGEIAPGFRDMLIYQFDRKDNAQDLIDKFNDSNWSLDEFKENEIPEKWQSLSKKELKMKLLEMSRKRNSYYDGFKLYTEKVNDFLEITIHPSLQKKTFNLAMREILSAQLLEFGYRER